jgi:hypothetical protein
MTILSQCAGDINPKIKRASSPKEIITLLPNEPHEFQAVSGIKPQDLIFDFEFVGPSEHPIADVKAPVVSKELVGARPTGSSLP